MNPWRPYPLIRLVIAFTAGILTAILHISDYPAPWWWAVVLFFIPGLLATFPGTLSAYRLRWIRGMMIFLPLVFLGNQYTVFFRPDYFREAPTDWPDTAACYIVVPEEVPAVRTKTVRVPARLEKTCSTSGPGTDDGSLLIYLQTDSLAKTVLPGDRLLIYTSPSEIQPPGVPGGFDMRAYYGRKGIFSQAYVASGRWKLLERNPGFSIRRMATVVRERLLRILKKNGVKGEEYPVAAALLLGYVSEIDRELLSDYSSSGAMHILSVSGMHVGVIYLFLEFVLGFLEKLRRNSILRWGKVLLIAAGIWAYALLTGFSPPVQRAALMLSMIIIGKNLKRQPDVLNILAASLFLVLLSDPFLILDVGCQFSYLAVAGIVLLYKPIYDLYVTSLWIPDKIWALIAVSVAAQLATFPLGLYVFHQFPNYFLLTNLLAVPLSNLIIYAGILLLACGELSWIGPLLGQLLSLLVALLNKVVRMIDAIPGSTLQGVYLTLPGTILLYLILVFGSLFLIWKKNLWLFLLLSAFILLSSSKLFSTVQHQRCAEIHVYHGKTTCIDLIAGSKQFLLKGDPLKGMDEYTRNQVADHWKRKGIRHNYSGYLGGGTERPAVQTHPSFLWRRGNYLLFEGVRIVILDRRILSSPEKPLPCDLLVLSSDPRMSLEQILRIYRPLQIVADGSNADWRIREWMQEARMLGVEIWVTGKEGPYLKTLPLHG